MLGNDKLKFLRQYHGLRQIDIADYIERSLPYVKKVENFSIEPTQEIHDKWLEACYSHYHTTKRDKEFK